MASSLERNIDFSKIPVRTWTDGRCLDISNNQDYYPRYPRWIRTALSEESFNLQPVFRLLDIGCGTGTAVYDMRRHGVEAYGIDIDVNPVMPYDNELFFQEDAQRTHFPESYFDALMESWMFAQVGLEKKEEIIPDILLEMNRILKENGYVISCPTGGGTLPSK